MTRRGASFPTLVVACVAALLLSGCQSAAPPAPAFSTPTPQGPAITVEPDIQYREVDGIRLAADSCRPNDVAAPTAAVVLVHGGGFTEGSRGSGGMADMCRALAQNGLAAFSIDYRLVPDHHYPAQTDDAAAAIAWLRAPEQVQRFNIDPARVAVLGSSAGAIIAQYLGTAGNESPDGGSNVRAVVSYSGVSDLSTKGLVYGKPGPAALQTILGYLGCSTVKAAECPTAGPASPIAHVNPGDAAMMLLNSTAEVVPVGQTNAMHAALDAAGVANTIIIDDGSKHGMQLNTGENLAAVIGFLQAHLA